MDDTEPQGPHLCARANQPGHELRERLGFLPAGKINLGVIRDRGFKPLSAGDDFNFSAARLFEFLALAAQGVLKNGWQAFHVFSKTAASYGKVPIAKGKKSLYRET